MTLPSKAFHGPSFKCQPFSAGFKTQHDRVCSGFLSHWYV